MTQKLLFRKLSYEVSRFLGAFDWKTSAAIHSLPTECTAILEKRYQRESHFLTVFFSFFELLHLCGELDSQNLRSDDFRTALEPIGPMASSIGSNTEPIQFANSKLQFRAVSPHLVPHAEGGSE